MESLMLHNPFHGDFSLQIFKRYFVFTNFLLISIFAVLFCIVFIDIFSIFQSHRVRIPNNVLVGSTGKAEACDYSNGRWVYHQDHPQSAYKEECPYLDPGFRCQGNGRKDIEYQKWRWQPFDCNLPIFDATDMLERSRNGRLVFVGDSIGRNQWESLVCMLAQVVSNKSSIYETNGNPISKHRGSLAIKFEEFNCTVEYYRDPFLAILGRPPKNSSAKVQRVIHVDKLLWYSTYWTDSDVLIFNSGHWWVPEKITDLGAYFQEGETVKMKMDTLTAFRKTLSTLKEWVLQKVDLQHNYVVFRSYSPMHFKGKWNEGGTCSTNKQPETNLTELEEEPWQNQIIYETVEKMKLLSEKVILLNITYLTELRKDGHPSKHRVQEEGMPPVPAIEDCSHWCLPGVPDTWNEILYAHLITRNYRIKH